MKKIVVVTNKYPNIYEENILIFLKELIWQFADLGYDVTVISPSTFTYNPKLIKLPYFSEEITSEGNTIKIYRPKNIGFGQKNFLFINPTKLTTFMFTRAVMRVLKKEKITPDFLYSHFVTPAGIAVLKISEKVGVKSFMAYGEALPNNIRQIGENNAKKELSKLTGIISVSTANKDRLVNMLSLNPQKITVIPNGVDLSKFKKIDKQISRDKMGFPQNNFIISFVGSFDHRKGIQRLEKAIEEIDDVYFIAAGKGKLVPKSIKCLHSVPVKHKDLPYFYNSADLFVLPTLSEGSCNAIIEAISCGVPVISSKGKFNDDILDDNYSVRIDPHSIDEIRKKIKELKDDKQRLEEFSSSALKISKKFDISIRARKILEFVERGNVK